MCHLEDSLRETTVHGFRYVVEGRSSGERLAWVFAIAGAFAFSGYLANCAIREARENPVVTSIEIVGVRDIPFPSVTVLAGGRRSPPPGPVTEALNALEFDCTQKDGRCMERTAGLRRDFEPLIHSVVRNTYLNWKGEVEAGRERIRVEQMLHGDEGPVQASYSRSLVTTFCGFGGELTPAPHGAEARQLPRRHLQGAPELRTATSSGVSPEFSDGEEEEERHLLHLGQPRLPRLEGHAVHPVRHGRLCAAGAELGIALRGPPRHCQVQLDPELQPHGPVLPAED